VNRQPLPRSEKHVEPPGQGHYNSFVIQTCRFLPAWRKVSSWLLVTCLSITGCASYRSPLPSVSAPSEDEETRISREFRREAKKHLKYISNPEIERYIERIGQRILSVMGPQPFEYRFFVVADPQLNAFAVPGGSVFFYTGLIERAKSTSEIAGVMGHEIVHIKGRHMARHSGPDAISLLSLVGMLLLARSGAGAQAAGVVGQAISATRQIAYSRQLEMEADTLGVRYMTSAGYDPAGSLGFLKTLDQERSLNPIDVPAYMLTHPVTQERVANVQLVIRSLGNVQSKSESLDQLKKIQVILRLERQETEKVIDEYLKSVKQNPQDSVAFHLLALAQHHKGELPQAKKNYEKALNLDPQDPGLHRDLGRLYTDFGEFSAARASLDRAVIMEAKEPLTYLYLGELLEKENDLRGAAGAYLNAHQLSPLWDKPPMRLATIYGKLDRLGDAYYYRARALVLQDEDERAIAGFEKAIKIVGENSARGQTIRDELNSLRARRR
jgi:beta-barrel assembly-enhancing protease